MLGCQVGLTGCSGLSATPAHHAPQSAVQGREPQRKREGSAVHHCAPAHCRGFAVSGGAPIQDTRSDASSDQAQSDPSGRSCAHARQRRAIEEGDDVADGAALLGAPDGAAFMQHFLSGRGTSLAFGPTSQLARLIARSAAFARTTRSVEAELKRRLVPLAARRPNPRPNPSPVHVRLDRTFLLAARPDFDNLSRDPDLYLSFRGTQGLLVHGAGRVYRSGHPDQSGHVTGRLTYTIRDVYGFGSTTQFRILGHAVGPDLHYLQTTCGAPAHRDGAHWFGDTVRVTTSFRFPLS